jgi:hypothetical protein
MNSQWVAEPVGFYVELGLTPRFGWTVKPKEAAFRRFWMLRSAASYLYVE